MGNQTRKKDRQKQPGQDAGNTATRKPAPDTLPGKDQEVTDHPVLAHDFGKIPLFGKAPGHSILSMRKDETVAATTSDTPTKPAEKPVEDPLTAAASSSLLVYKVDKTGRILGFNIDAISKLVFARLQASERAHIIVRGFYPRGDTDFEVAKPGNDIAKALVQWIGKKRIPRIEDRIQSDYEDSGPLPQGQGGRIEVEVFYDPVVQSYGKELTGAKEIPGVKDDTKKEEKKKEPEVERSLVVDPLSGTVETQIEMTWDAPVKVVKEFKITLHIGPKGFDQIEADLAVLKHEISLRKYGMGDSKLTITAGLNLGVDFDRDRKQRLNTEFSAALKSAVELELAIPGLPSPPSIDLSGSINHEGKPSWELQVTIFKWK